MGITVRVLIAGVQGELRWRGQELPRAGPAATIPQPVGRASALSGVGEGGSMEEALEGTHEETHEDTQKEVL